MHLVVVAVDGHHVVWELFLGARNMTQRCFDIREPFLRSELQRFFPALAEKGLLSHFCFWERSSPPPLPTSRQGDSASMLSGEGCPVPLGLDAPQLCTRVSVGQLRSALLQQAGSGAQPEKLYDLLHVCDPDWHYQPVYPLWPYLSTPQHLLPAVFVWTLAARMPRPLWIWPWSRAPRGAGDAPGATSPVGQAPVARPASASGRSRSRPMRWRRAAGRGCVLWSGCRLCRECTGLLFFSQTGRCGLLWSCCSVLDWSVWFT